MRPIVQPVLLSGVENAYPGSEGATTWKAWTPKAPKAPEPAAGLTSGSISWPNSATELGKPWVISSGLAPGWPAPDVQEVDALAIYFRRELRIGVELRLGCAPVVLSAPVIGEFPHGVQRYAALPPHAGQLARPPGAGQPVVQMVEVGLGDLDAKRVDAVAHHASPVNAAVVLTGKG